MTDDSNSDAGGAQRVIRIWGLRRSGLHALATWLGFQLPAPVWIFNDLAEHHPVGSDPYRAHQTSAHYAAYLRHSDRFRLPTDADRAVAKPSVVLVYEEVDVEPFPLEPFLGPIGRLSDVVLCRDPFNLMASRLRGAALGRLSHRTLPPARALELWERLARRLAAGDREGGGDGGDQLVPVAYNLWQSSLPARRALAERLGLRFDDRGSREVSGAGGGSSFEGRAFHGAGNRMRTAERFARLAGDPAYRALFSGRRDLLALSESVFGEIPGTGELLTPLAAAHPSASPLLS